MIKSVTKTIKSEAIKKEQTGGFLGMLLRALGASLLGNLLTGKGTTRAGEVTISADGGTNRAGQNF